MRKRTKELLLGLMIGLGLAAALLIAGCDVDDLAQSAGASGSGHATAAGDSGQTPDASTAGSAGVVDPSPDTADAITGASPSILSIETLIDNAAAYDGQEILLQGTILTQCIRGCQFSLDDGTGVVGVELVDEALENVLMHGSVGRTVLVRGVVGTSPRPLILVETRDGWSYVD